MLLTMVAARATAFATGSCKRLQSGLPQPSMQGSRSLPERLLDGVCGDIVPEAVNVGLVGGAEPELGFAPPKVRSNVWKMNQPHHDVFTGIFSGRLSFLAMHLFVWSHFFTQN